MALHLRLSLHPPLPRASRSAQPQTPPLLKSGGAQRQAPPVRGQQTLSPATPSPLIRQTANFHPTMFDDAFIQSLNTFAFTDDLYVSRREMLKNDVSQLILKQKGLVDQLELLDSLQQLSIAYLFEKEIKDVLSRIYSYLHILSEKLRDDVHATSLLFRLLREHGFVVSEDILIKSFQDEHGDFKSTIVSDTKGLLSLYEATFLAEDGDDHLDLAQKFAKMHLREKRLYSLDNDASEDKQLVEFIDHALELPLHWRTPRLHSLWFINAYERKDKMNPKLVMLAKLDFNIVQSMYKLELKEVSRWWRKLDLANGKLKYARDWPVESYIWTVGLISEPQFSSCRKHLAKIVCFLHIIDDIYDVYGSLDELEAFTNAIHRWDLAAIDELPEYMKSCFLALFNTVNEVAYNIFKNKGLDVLSYLKRAWLDICNAFLQEARWYNNVYSPTLVEYMDNAWISAAAPLSLVFSQCLSKDLKLESLEKLVFYPAMTRYSSTIFRLYDDLGTSKEELQRGDVEKSLQCYMNERHVTETVANERMKDLIYRNWKLLNGEHVANSHFEETFKRVVLNLPRMAQFMYDNRDGNGKPNHKMKGLILLLLIEPIPM